MGRGAEPGGKPHGAPDRAKRPATGARFLAALANPLLDFLTLNPPVSPRFPPHAPDPETECIEA